MSELSSIRNVAFVGHPSVGKTSLVDALAHLIGASPRKGSVVDKTSICDTEPEEQEKQHTLQLASVWADWSDKTWTLFDTPGYPEFVAEVQAAMFAADLVVGVVSCGSGATYNLRTKMKHAAQMGRGRAVIITHLDVENADFEQTVMDLREGVGEECVPVLLPDASGPSFSAVQRTILDLESEWCGRLKDRVMDACQDEDLLMEYLENQELSEDQLDKHMHTAIAEGALVPVLVCNPESGVGVEAVVEFLKRFAPCPTDIPTLDADGEPVTKDASGEFTGTVFSVVTDPHVGKVCLARIHRGTLKASDLVSADGGKGEKLGGLFRLVGKKRESVEAAGAGDIVAFSKVEKLPTWSNFSLGGGAPVAVPTPVVPSPMVGLAVFPKTRADEQKIGEALSKLSAEDPTLTIEHTVDTHEVVVHCMSDVHLHLMFERMKRRYNVEVATKLPTIAYKETITKAAEGHHRHKKQTGGRGQFGECFLRLRPAPQGSGIVFADKVVGGAIPRNLIPAVEKGLREVCAKGILTHGQVVDVEAELYDGKFHAVDSDEGSFRMAGGRAFRAGFEKGNPVLLEPVVKV
ncbi:MAG: GTP-binding protein [Planctomycetota bacterium]